MNFKIEELSEKNIKFGFFETLKNLRSDKLVVDVEKAKKILKEIKKDPNHKIFVAISNSNEIIGSVTLFVEQKFILNFTKWGHLEDVVTRKGYEKKGIGRALVNKATEVAKKMNCERIMLSCQDNRMDFYRNCGYVKNSNPMKNELNK